jgi:2-oxo-hept-3-ene-1,7-dioate hydratase
MLTPDQVAEIAAELAEADRAHTVIPRITARYPDATVEDSYAIQGVWRDGNLAAGRRLVGRKIGLTSKAMQQATGITEPDYGVMFEDTVYATGSTRRSSRTCASRSSSRSC